MTLHDWFSARLSPQWEAEGLEVVADQDEILVVIDLGERVLDGADVRLFREATRDERMALAAEAELTFGRKVSWGLKAAGQVVVFTSTSVPVMTRLRLPERRVLDTLIDGGIARTRSEALAWCVRLVGENEKEWIAALRAAFEAVHDVRERGPLSRRRDRR